MIRSFRVRLTLWNVAVIALVLLAFSAGIVLTNQARLSADIDRELFDRAHSPPGGPFGGPPGRRGPGRGGPGDDGNPPDHDNQDVPPRFNDPVAIRFADVRRPRRFNPQGKPIGPNQDEPFDAQALQLARTGDPTYTNGTYDGEPIRIYTMRIRQGPNEGQLIQVARETHDLDRIWSAQLGTLALFLPGAILGAAAGAFFLTSRAIKPIAHMKEAASAISEKDLSKRLKVEGQDEFAELGVTFNAMVDRLEESFSKLRTAYDDLEEAHETQKRFTADASHELRTPLTRIRLAASGALSETATPEEQRKALQVVDAAAESIGRLVQEMLVLARADAGQLTIRAERIDLRVVATDVMQTFSPDNVELAADLQDSPVTIMGDEEHLRRVLANLIENALRYTPPGGTIKIAVGADGPMAMLTVSDTGEGVSPEHLPHLT
ncbi:MAG TPA: HAMP domain-containing sensor histidine kinase, partial [Fimbriimonadaceae bacterium]|nr:HAMP domain-containing sensor histidine kinase [Fimbriimonadaceae bacterium]